jgi:methyl-accepting chemotaxis protein
MQSTQASDSPTGADDPGDRAGGVALPVWFRLVVAISVMLVGTWSVMIYITYAQQRDESIAQSRNFAQSVYQMTVATITAMMITDTSKRRDVFLDQIRNSSDVTDIRVLRFGSVIDQYGAGDLSERNHSPEEKAVMEAGQPSFKVSDDGAILNAVIPIRNSPDFLGKDCTKCHEGKADEVLGAVSMKLRLQKAQAALRDFTWRLVLLASALSLPLLGSIYYFVRRLVNRPLGGEPAAAMAVVNRVAAGDLLVDIDVKDSSRSSVLLSLKAMVGSLTHIVDEVRSSAGAFSGASEQLSAAAQSMNEAASEQAASVEETSAAVEQMTATITQNAQNARQASELAVSGSEVARKGGQVVGQVVSTMEDISASSRKIATSSG